MQEIAKLMLYKDYGENEQKPAKLAFPSYAHTFAGKIFK
jgi:hypothetical protein